VAVVLYDNAGLMIGASRRSVGVVTRAEPSFSHVVLYEVPGADRRFGSGRR
jgi:hypothetical protein